MLAAAAAGAAAALVAGCGGAPAGSAALKILPSDVRLVVGLDLAAARASAPWADGETLVHKWSKDEASRAPFEAIDDARNELRKKLGLDPLLELATVVVGVTVPKRGDPEVVAVITAAAGARFDEEGLVDWVESKAGDLDHEEMWGAKIYERKAAPDLVLHDTLAVGTGAFSLFLADERTLVVGSPDAVEAVAGLRAGRGKSAATDSALAAAVKRVEGGAALWAAAATNDVVEDALRHGPLKGLDDATDATVSVVAAKGVHVGARLGFKKAEDASGVAEALDEAVRALGKEAKALHEHVPWLRAVYEAYASRASGTDVLLTVDLGEDVLADVAKWARKEGPGVMDLGLGSFPGFGEKTGVAPTPPAPFAPDGPATAVVEAKPAPAGSGACARYASCLHGLARAYGASSFSGAREAGDAMEKAALEMEKTLVPAGAGADESCKMGLDALREAMPSFSSMPGFVFPDECK
jgi:hypothetical protein